MVLALVRAAAAAVVVAMAFGLFSFQPLALPKPLRLAQAALPSPPQTLQVTREALLLLGHGPKRMAAAAAAPMVVVVVPAERWELQVRREPEAQLAKILTVAPAGLPVLQQRLALAAILAAAVVGAFISRVQMQEARQLSVGAAVLQVSRAVPLEINPAVAVVDATRAEARAKAAMGSARSRYGKSRAWGHAPGDTRAWGHAPGDTITIVSPQSRECRSFR